MTETTEEKDPIELVKAEKAIDAALDAFEALDKALTQEGDKK